jgi:hypothetical protein
MWFFSLQQRRGFRCSLSVASIRIIDRSKTTKKRECGSIAFIHV